MRIPEILKKPEDKSLEFKKEIPKNRQDLLKTVVAFANGTGGHIYAGVNDDRTVAGIKEEPFDLEEKLSNIIFDSISPIPIPVDPDARAGCCTPINQSGGTFRKQRNC